MIPCRCPLGTETMMDGGLMVEYIGYVSRKEINRLYGRSRVGIVLYQPAGNHYESQPIKIFEYMAAGLPVVASDFPLWREIVEENCCGVCVSPVLASEVANALKTLLSHPEKAQRMGRNGRDAVVEKYNWDEEEPKLLELYSEICE